MRIYHNLPALNTYNNLNINQSAIAKSLSKLSSGLRINSAADDAAGLAISEKMRAQVRGLDMATRNAQDGISMIQTAEGALQATVSILQRMRELAVQSANDTLTSQDRAFIQLEIDQLRDEIDRTASTTQFNRRKLLDGSSDALWSSNKLGVWVNVKGSLSSVDQFGQVSEMEGNYKISVAALNSGQNQVLKSNVFRMAEYPPSIVAGKNSRLGDIANFMDANGVSVFDSPQTLTVSFEDGSSTSFAVYSSDTLGEFGEKMAQAIQQAAGMTKESGTAVPGSPVQFVGYDYKVPGRHDHVANALASHWLQGSASLIKEFYNLDGNGASLHITYNYGMTVDFPNMFCTQDTDGVIWIGMNPKVINENTDTYDLSIVIAHEMVHASMRAHPNLASAQRGGDGSGTWLIEGLADYIANGNRRTLDAVEREGPANFPDYIKGCLFTLFNSDDDDYWENPSAYTPVGEDTWYTAGYLAVRYFDEESRANGGTGIIGLLDELKETGGGEPAMSAAIFKASNGRFADYDTFRSEMMPTSTTADKFDAFIAKVAIEDRFEDRGAIGGYYAWGGPKQVWNTVVPKPDDYRINPISDYGWYQVNWHEMRYEDFDRLFPNHYWFQAATNIGGVRDSGASNNLASSHHKAGTMQSVEGTLLIHSPIVGSAGRMTISGDERLLQGLGLAEIQDAVDPIYQVTLTDAHNGARVAPSMIFSGNTIVEALNNIDITFGTNFAFKLDSKGVMSGKKGTAPDEYGYGTYKFIAGAEDFILHIVSNSTVLQIGANEGESLILSFGDAGVKALGIHKVSLLNRESASRSITIIDNAITSVLTKMSKLGAYQNRLEHTVNNLTMTSENLTASESRIRDLDIAKEMMNFTKLNILLQSGQAMLAQANQLPQNILQLIR